MQTFYQLSDIFQHYAPGCGGTTEKDSVKQPEEKENKRTILILRNIAWGFDVCPGNFQFLWTGARH